jgi:hypothetical protein
MEIDDPSDPKRILVLAIAAAFAAMPLVWFAVDANAGDKLLRMTSSGSTVSQSATQAPARPASRQ